VFGCCAVCPLGTFRVRFGPCFVLGRAGPTLFPYTTLFRSGGGHGSPEVADHADHQGLVEVVGDVVLVGPAEVDLHQVAQGVKPRSEEHTSELQSRFDLVCRLLLEIKTHPTTSSTTSYTQRT